MKTDDNIPGLTFGEDDSIGKQMIRIALKQWRPALWFWEMREYDMWIDEIERGRMQ